MLTLAIDKSIAERTTAADSLSRLNDLIALDVEIGCVYALGKVWAQSFGRSAEFAGFHAVLPQTIFDQIDFGVNALVIGVISLIWVVIQCTPDTLELVVEEETQWVLDLFALHIVIYHRFLVTIFASLAAGLTEELLALSKVVY